MDQDQPKRIRRYASTIGILILLAAVLSFYYLKYVPERRTEFNRAAFLELNQIEYALQYQNRAYHDALQNIIQEVYKKITGLLTTVTSLLPLLTGMFGKPAGKSADS